MSEWEGRIHGGVEWANRLYSEEKFEQAWAQYTEVLALEKKARDEADQFQLLRCRINRGILAWRTERPDKAREDWLKVAQARVPRCEWLDRVRIRALRNLAFLEDLPPHESPWIRQALADFGDSSSWGVQGVLFDAALGAPWPYEGDSAPGHLLQTLRGKSAETQPLTRVWRSLNRQEREACRGWWGKKSEEWENKIGVELKDTGPGFSDELWHIPHEEPRVALRLHYRDSARGGVKALLLRSNGRLGWLGCDGETEFPPDPPLKGNAARLFSWDLQGDRLALVREGRNSRVEWFGLDKHEWIQHPRPPVALAWGTEVAWVDDQGFFKGVHPISTQPLKGVAALGGGFLVWDAVRCWRVTAEGQATPFPHPHPIDHARVSGKRLFIVSGQTVGAYTLEGTLRGSWELPWVPRVWDAQPTGVTAWSNGQEVLVFRHGKEIRRMRLPEVQSLRLCGEFVAVGCGDWSVRLLGFSSTPDKILRHHHDWVVDLAWDSGKNILYSGALDGSVAGWNLNTLGLEAAWGQHGGLSIQPYGNAWLSRGLSWVSTDGGSRVWGIGDPLTGVVGDGRSWEATTLGGGLVRDGRTTDHPAPGPYLGLFRIRGENYVATRGALWQTQTGRRWELWEQEIWITCLTEITEITFAVGSSAGSLALWNGEKWLSSEAWHEGVIRQIFFVPELWAGPDATTPGSLVSVGEDGKIFLWNAGTLQAVEILKKNKKPLLGALSSKRSLVAWDGSYELKVWNLPGRGGNWEVAAHKGGVSCAVATQDGGLLFSGGKEGEVRMWQLPGVEPLGRIAQIPEPVTGLALHPDGVLGILGRSGAVSELFWRA